MSLVPALCTQCGAQLEVDSSQEAALCPHCHTPFITEKAINNYNTTNVTNIGSLHADVVQLSDERSIDNRVKSGDTFIKLEEFESARNIFESLIKECPYDYRSWMGMIRVCSKDYTDFNISRKELNNIEYLYANAKKVSDSQNNIEGLCDEYIKTMKNNLDLLSQNTFQNIKQAKDSHNLKVQEHRRKIDLLNQEKEKAKFPATPIMLVVSVISIILGIADWSANGAFSGILAIIVYGAIGFGIGRVLEGTWGKTCEKKISELNNSIRAEENKISMLKQELQKVLMHYGELLEKATGSTPNYQDIYEEYLK